MAKEQLATADLDADRPDGTTGHDIREPGLTEHVRVGEQSIRHRREFRAPARLVQRTHTDPDLFTRWMGPRARPFGWTASMS